MPYITLTPNPEPQVTEQPPLARTPRTRTYRGHKRVPTNRRPTVRLEETKDGKLLAHVELGGKLGEGHEATFDAADRERLKSLGIEWMTVANGTGGYLFVSATGRKAQYAAAVSGTTQQDADTSSINIPVGRLLTGAKKYQRVWHLDRNPLNLRRDNLELLTWEEFKEKIADMRLCLPLARAIREELEEAA